MTFTIPSESGSDLDTGWTGISHNQPTIDKVKTTVNLNCTGDDGVVDGSALSGTPFGCPLTLAAAGVPSGVLHALPAGPDGP